MKNQAQWQPTRIRRDNQSQEFVVDISCVYAGSVHVAKLQFDALYPLLLKYCHGKLLDAGCGSVPYFELLGNQVSTHYCIDHPDRKDARPFIDEPVDLNAAFQLSETDFDAILLGDVLAHIKEPGILLEQLARHLRTGGVIIITTPFVYWMSEYPNEYCHFTEFALRHLLEKAGFVVEFLEPYGGYPDVLLDTLNKGMTGSVSNRLFRLLASVVKKSSRYKKSNAKTMYSYPLGYSVVARKL